MKAQKARWFAVGGIFAAVLAVVGSVAAQTQTWQSKMDSALVTSGTTSTYLLNVQIGGGGSAALADATSNPSIAALGSYLFGFNGTTWDRLRVDSSKNLLVTLGTGLDGANDTVSVRVNNVAPAALADNTTLPTTIHVASDLFAYDGTNMDLVRLDGSTGNLLVNQAGRATIATGSATCGNGSAVQFASNAVKEACFKNPGTNTVWVGGSAVAATTAFVSLATGESVCLQIANANQVYCIASGATQVLPYIGDL